MGYSEDLRKRVVEYLGEGHTLENTKAVFKVGISSIRRWKEQLDEQGHLKNKPLNRTFKKLDPQKLSAYVEEHPDAYLREIGDIFGCTDEAVRQALGKLRITRKKNENLPGTKRRKAQGIS